MRLESLSADCGGAPVASYEDRRYESHYTELYVNAYESICA